MENNEDAGEKGNNIDIGADENIIKINKRENTDIKRKDDVVEIKNKNKTIEIKNDGKIKIDTEKVKKHLKTSFEFFKQKKVINILIIILFLIILIGSSWMRLQNLPLLKDSTTGEYVLADLDAFYFLRVAETIIETDGNLPAYDPLRKPFNINWHPEILPQILVNIYKIVKVFYGDITLKFIDVISPVIFFVLGLIVFFFLIYFLTKSKITAFLSGLFLAFIPSYLFRTTAGVSDHDSIGMLFFFLTMLLFGIALKYIEKESSKKELINIILWGLIVGFSTALLFGTWEGSVKFIYLIIPLSLFILWVIHSQNSNLNKILKKMQAFYLIWIISSIIFATIISGRNLTKILEGIFLTVYGIALLLVFGFIIIDYLLIKYKKDIGRYRVVYTSVLAITFGIIFLFVAGQNPFSMIYSVFEKLLHPFGLGRVGLTVAENSQPYLNDWINQIGKVFFWIFVGGLIVIGTEICKKIESKKEKSLFLFLWIIMFSGILFSRISSGHILNGTNFISKVFYMGGSLIFVGYSAKIYFENKIKINSEWILIVVWMIFMIISIRGATRLFFVITPFVSFCVGLFIVKTFEGIQNNKEEIIKIILIFILVLVVVGSIYSLIGFYKDSKYQAKYTGPSANYQWQYAMSWVRENTPENSVFIHWWDYGYFIQSLGERPTIVDGGHFQGEFRNHLIGRYVLTTPFPETALSFIKSYNISYLLIDQTDLGKYSAYSKIGSDKEWDRFSYTGPFLSDKSQIKEISNGTIRVYQGGIGVDEDIIYEEENSKVFIPGPIYDSLGNPTYKSYVGGVLLELINSEEGVSLLKQPEAIFIYNNQQIKIPVRYLYFNKQIQDFEKGIDAIFFIFPSIEDNGQGGISLDNFGAGIYLSPKVSKSLFAQIYLLNDIFKKYESVKLVHSEDDIIIKNIKEQGVDLGEFVYYQGFRGPIKIWEIHENKSILAKEEFLRKSGEYAEFDDLEFFV